MWRYAVCVIHSTELRSITENVHSDYHGVSSIDKLPSHRLEIPSASVLETLLTRIIHLNGIPLETDEKNRSCMIQLLAKAVCYARYA